MAETQVSEGSPPNNATPIQFLHALWERSNDVHNAIDEASPSEQAEDPSARVKASWFNDGMVQVHQQAYHLQMALMYEQPLNMTDAVILAGHISSHVSGIDTTVEQSRKEAFEALERAQSSLFAFLAEQTDFECGGYSLDSVLRSARREVALRTGRPEDWDQFRSRAA